MTSATYLVTGGTGFVGSRILLQLLEQGFKVKTSVRSLSKEDQLRKSLVLSSEKGLTKATVDANLSLFVANLTSDDGWEENFKDVTYVLHVASPFPAVIPKDPQELIKPAVEGTLRVLKWAKATPTVKRVVITSSFAAVGYGQSPTRTEPFTENDWTDINGVDRPYIHSKVLAERAAWNFIDNEKPHFDLAVLNPAYIFGPTLKEGTADSTSIALIANLLNGSLKEVPSMYISLIDIRDVAKLHIDAATNPKAGGQRFVLTTGESTPYLQLANILRENLPADKTSKIPTKEVESPKDYFKPVSSQKAEETFNWTPIPTKEVLLASAKSIFEEQGL
ncbi:putative short chain dehydrogenase [Scheffersomyces amazonensis]|uniref:putative short chain dehydrogenase n=1 Tax=Scheffersomyces amazonensis TaxID=1078765 RepID=UPI00315C7E3B